VLVNSNRNKEKVVLIPTPDVGLFVSLTYFYLLVGEKWHFASRKRKSIQHKNCESNHKGHLLSTNNDLPWYFSG